MNRLLASRNILQFTRCIKSSSIRTFSGIVVNSNSATFTASNPIETNNINAPTQSAPAATNAAAPKSRRLREKVAPISLTQRAADRIKEIMSGKEDAIGVKIGVRRRGCNGYSYTMNYATADDLTNSKDEIVQNFGVKVFVDPKAIFYIVGTVMDFEETELSSEFTFNNPNSKGECGCGESFNV